MGNIFFKLKKWWEKIWYGYSYIKEVKLVKYNYIEYLKFWNILLGKRSGFEFI